MKPHGLIDTASDSDQQPPNCMHFQRTLNMSYHRLANHSYSKDFPPHNSNFTSAACNNLVVEEKTTFFN